MPAKPKAKVEKLGYKLDDFNSKGGLLKSPRTKEACIKLGYEPSELLFKAKEDFGISDKEVLEVRFKAYEEKRKKKIKNVMDERAKMSEKTPGSKSKQIVKINCSLLCHTFISYLFNFCSSYILEIIILSNIEGFDASPKTTVSLSSKKKSIINGELVRTIENPQR